MTGTRVAHYDILEKLGEGGMGVVYRARDIQLNRFVALKMLPPAGAADQARRERFLQEARAASALNHPNIVIIHDVIQHGDAQAIVMEFLKGKTLAELIPRKGLRTGEVLRYAVQIADALAAAHQAGIIHRDLKPGNIVVGENGHAKILDFGLAKVAEPAPAAPEGEETRTLRPRTQEGAILGTTAYMSPEQAEGKPVDVRSDVFSFGTVLFEMISGEQPFRGDSNMGTLAAILTREPAALPADTPHDLAMIVTRCLRKDPARRFQHMIDVKLALEDLKEMSESGTLPGLIAVPARRRRVWPWVGAAVLLVLAVAGIAWYLMRPRPASLTLVPLTSYPGAETTPALSPDGNLVAFSWDGPNGGNPDIYVLQIGGGSPLRLTTSPLTDVFPVWSPDGRQIAFMRVGAAEQQGVYTVAALGGPERRLADAPQDPNRPSLAWSPNGKYLIYTDAGKAAGARPLWRVSVDSGEKRPLTAPGKANDAGAAFTSDTDLVFFRYAGYENGDLYRLRWSREGASQGEPERLTSDRRLILGTARARGGRLIFSSNRGGSRALWTMKPGSGPVKLAVGDNGAFPSTAIGRNLLVYAEQINDTNVWVLDTTGRQPARPIIASTREDAQPAYSPDDRRIAFASMRSGNWEIWAAGADGSNPVQLTYLAGPRTLHPSWSPDGKRILFDSVQGDRRDLYVMSADGGPIQRLTTQAAENLRGNWSPDGQWIFFCSNRSATYQIWRMPGGGGPAVQITRNGGREAYPSPDGKLVYFLRQFERAIFSIPAAGGEEKKVLEIGELDQWAVTPAGLYVLDRSAKPRPVIVFYDFSTRRSRPALELPGELRANAITGGMGMAASHDGRSILLTHRDRAGSDLVMVENFR